MYPTFPRQSPEDPFGNKEYKLKILIDGKKNIINILRKLVKGYNPSERIVDYIFNEKQKRI